MIPSIKETGEIFFRDERVDICIKCGHCMAMCETKSISIEGLSYETNFREIPASIPDHDALKDFLLTRRSVRVFKNKSVPAEILQKIVDIVATAPYGVHPDNVEITLISDKSLIEKAVPYMSKTYFYLAQMLKIPLLGGPMRKSMPRETANTLMNFIIPHVGQGFYIHPEKLDDIARNAPAMILFHAPKGAEEHTVDAHIYLTYALLAAHSLGLGAAAIGLIGPAINHSKPLREMFLIPAGNEVVLAMVLGYPKLQFKYGISRPRKKITFIP
jgi:nitroreductase